MLSISARFSLCYPRGITPHDVIEKILGNLLPSWEQKSAHRTQCRLQEWMKNARKITNMIPQMTIS